MRGDALTAAVDMPAPERSSPRGALAIALLCVLGVAIVWVFAALIPGSHFRDAVLLGDFSRLDPGPARWVASHLIHLLEPLLFTIWGIALVAIALARERPRLAIAVVAVMGLAPLSAEVLKPLLAHPHDSVGLISIGPASLPSGHTTAATALAFSAVLVTPRRLRPLVSALAVAFAGAVGLALLIRAAHMPSDVLAGYLVASFWVAIAVAGLRAAERRWPTGRAPALA
jgi:membrane-associated phospholipid phosphatase